MRLHPAGHDPFGGGQAILSQGLSKTIWILDIYIQIHNSNKNTIIK